MLLSRRVGRHRPVYCQVRGGPRRHCRVVRDCAVPGCQAAAAKSPSRPGGTLSAQRRFGLVSPRQPWAVACVLQWRASEPGRGREPARPASTSRRWNLSVTSRGARSRRQAREIPVDNLVDTRAGPVRLGNHCRCSGRSLGSRGPLPCEHVALLSLNDACARCRAMCSRPGRASKRGRAGVSSPRPWRVVFRGAGPLPCPCV